MADNDRFSCISPQLLGQMYQKGFSQVASGRKSLANGFTNCVCKLPAFQTIRDYTHVFVGFQDMNPWPLAEYCKHDQYVGLLVAHLWSPSGLVVLLPCCCRVSASGSGNCLL